MRYMRYMRKKLKGGTIVVSLVPTGSDKYKNWVNRKNESSEWEQCIRSAVEAMRRPVKDDESPNYFTYVLALRLLKEARKTGAQPPIRIDQEPTGGLIVTFEEENETDEWTFYNSGQLEFTKYIDNKVVLLEHFESHETRFRDMTDAQSEWDCSDALSSQCVTKVRATRHQEWRHKDDLVHSW